jgi:hypothetical protein
MKLVLNEKELVRKSLEEGYIDKKPTNTIKILIKHYFLSGMDKHQVRTSIDVFLRDNLVKYNPVKWDDILTKLIKKAEKDTQQLIIVENVHITNTELNIIKNINNIDLEKLAFTYLVYSKIYNGMNGNEADWVNADRSEIFKDAKITASTQKQRLMVNDLIELGLIESSKRRNCSNKKVLFVDHTGEPELEITDFRETGFIYMKWKGENIGECDCCKILFKVNGKNHKMCKACWKDRQKEIKRRVWHENKEKYRC